MRSFPIIVIIKERQLYAYVACLVRSLLSVKIHWVSNAYLPGNFSLLTNFVLIPVLNERAEFLIMVSKANTNYESEGT